MDLAVQSARPIHQLYASASIFYDWTCLMLEKSILGPQKRVGFEQVTYTKLTLFLLFFEFELNPIEYDSWIGLIEDRLKESIWIEISFEN